MMNPILVKTYKSPGIDYTEALRYAGIKGESSDLNALMFECIDESRAILSYKVCYTRAPLTLKEEEGIVSFSFGQLRSNLLLSNLRDCEEAVIFAATIGIAFDRLISKYSRISPSKGLMLQGLGTERIESLCNEFNGEVTEEEAAKGRFTRPRFSPGYGDLPIEKQKLFFDVLDCNRKIGLTLNDSMLMSPSKSVTAIIGISNVCNNTKDEKRNCTRCNKKDCVYRI